jgi:hypothetical protein
VSRRLLSLFVCANILRTRSLLFRSRGFPSSRLHVARTDSYACPSPPRPFQAIAIPRHFLRTIGETVRSSEAIARRGTLDYSCRVAGVWGFSVKVGVAREGHKRHHHIERRPSRVARGIAIQPGRSSLTSRASYLNSRQNSSSRSNLHGFFTTKKSITALHAGEGVRYNNNIRFRPGLDVLASVSSARNQQPCSVAVGIHSRHATGIILLRAHPLMVIRDTPTLVINHGPVPPIPTRNINRRTPRVLRRAELPPKRATQLTSPTSHGLLAMARKVAM